MPHDTPLISTIVAGLVLAFILGAIANRFRMPPLVGYLVAGIVVGPYTPGFVANGELATELSELGVILLMFGVGLHFSLKDLLSVRALAIPGAIVQIAGATIMGLGLATLLGWSLGAGLIFGLALSVASTVVLLKALQDRHMVESEKGRIAVGWLIVEDIAMVLALVLIPAIASLTGATSTEVHDPFLASLERLTGWHLNVFGILGVTLVKLAGFVGFMLVVGRRVIPAILHFTAHTGSRELFRLAVLAIALGVAAGAAYLFGVSLALGAFFAGMILSESALSQRAAQESLPLRDAFAVLFFVSVGMLFDPHILFEQPLPVLGTVFIIVFGKSVLAFLIVVAFRRPASTALIISASLAQIGEFSFILAALGVGLGILPVEAQSLILAGAIISIILNPLVFYAVEHIRERREARIAPDAPMPDTNERIEPALKTAPALAAEAKAKPAVEADDRRPTSLTGHTVLIGYGRVGSVVAEGLATANAPFVLIEDADKRVAAAHAAGIEVIVGNAATPESLALANVAAAATVLIAIPNAFEAGQAVEQARHLNAKVTIISRAHAEEEIGYLTSLGANHVIMGEREIGLGMLAWVTGGKDRTEPVHEHAGFNAVAAALKLDFEPEAVAPPPTPVVAEPEPAEAKPELVTETDFPAEVSPGAEVEPEPMPELVGAAPTPPTKSRPTGPATAPASPFNPEVPPKETA
jgi:monovalent cation:H+ antiporter-2, CPA2 family